MTSHFGCAWLSSQQTLCSKQFITLFWSANTIKDSNSKSTKNSGLAGKDSPPRPQPKLL